MDFILNGLLQKFEIWLLILIRVTALFIISPIFGRRNLPTIFKVGFCCIVAFLLLNVVSAPAGFIVGDFTQIIVIGVKELLVGAMIGFISFVVMSAIYFAGQIIDTQIGFGIVSVIDPVNSIQVPVTSNFFYTFAMLIFLNINGHHMLIEALAGSYSIVPIGEALYSSNMIEQFTKIMSMTMVVGFKISAPIIATVLICDIALGIMSRTMPQMNILILGMPIKIFVGLIVIVITVPAFLGIVGYLIDQMNVQSKLFLEQMIQK